MIDWEMSLSQCFDSSDIYSYQLYFLFLFALTFQVHWLNKDQHSVQDAFLPILWSIDRYNLSQIISQSDHDKFYNKKCNHCIAIFNNK